MLEILGVFTSFVRHLTLSKVADDMLAVSNTVIRKGLKPMQNMSHNGAEKCFHINNFIAEPGSPVSPWSWRTGGRLPPCRPGGGRPPLTGCPGLGTPRPAPCPVWVLPPPWLLLSPWLPWCSSKGPDTCWCNICEAESGLHYVSRDTEPEVTSHY